MHLDEIASRVWGCVDGGGLLLMGLCCELRVVVDRWWLHCVLPCVHIDGNSGMARVCRKEEGSEIWLRSKSVVDLGVERVRGFSFNLPFPRRRRRELSVSRLERASHVQALIGLLASRRPALQRRR